MIDNNAHDLAVLIDDLPDTPPKHRCVVAVDRLIAERNSKELNWKAVSRQLVAALNEHDVLRVSYDMALSMIETLQAERDEYQAEADTMAAAHKVERDALHAAANLALYSMKLNQYAVADASIPVDVMLYNAAIEALTEALK